jgi:hypothetical protein
MLDTLLTTRLRTIAPKIYPIKAPKNYATPCVIYNRLSTDFARDLGTEGECGFVVMQIDVYDPIYLTAKALAAAIRKNLTLWSDAAIQSVECADEHDMIDETTGVSLYRTMLTFVIFADLA